MTIHIILYYINTTAENQWRSIYPFLGICITWLVNWDNKPQDLPLLMCFYAWKDSFMKKCPSEGHHVLAPYNAGVTCALRVYRSRERSWIRPARNPKPSFSIAASDACSVPLILFCNSCDIHGLWCCCSDECFDLSTFNNGHIEYCSTWTSLASL